jgi:hypothetical protein
LHHLDLIALIGTGRRNPSDSERTDLGELAKKLPVVLG